MAMFEVLAVASAEPKISEVVHCALVDETKVIMTRTKRRAIATNWFIVFSVVVLFVLLDCDSKETVAVGFIVQRRR